MEADLRRFCGGLDYRDRWAFEPVLLRNGQAVLRRKLSTRMIFVQLHDGLPPESAVAIHVNGGRWPWKLTDHLLADLWFLQRQVAEGKKAKDHPNRPRPRSTSTMTPERARKMRDAARRAKAEAARRNYEEAHHGG